MQGDAVLTDNSLFITPLGLGLTLTMCLLLLGLPRRYALVPIIVLVCFMTMGERLVVAGLDFPMLRILMLAGWARVIVRGEAQLGQWTPIDKALIAFIISSIVSYTILWGTSEAFINRLGQAYNLLGSYFLFRFLIRDTSDIVRAFNILAICAIPLASAMLIEKISGRNAFAIFGGVPLLTAVRNGAVRCQGPFAHPILAGTFGATIFPFLFALWWQAERKRLIYFIGMLSSIVIVLTSSSSGPVIALLSGWVGLTLWPLRRNMRMVRWGILLLVIGLEAVMEAHIWFLIARINLVSGSTAYYRAYLIDRFIANFSDWWLLGIKSTGVWAEASLGLHDRTNQYIVYAADGGLITLIMAISIITYAFRSVGRAWRAVSGTVPRLQFSIWALGAALFAHVVNFISVSYFDQNVTNWYLLLAMIATASVVGQAAQTKAITDDDAEDEPKGLAPLWEDNLSGIRP